MEPVGWQPEAWIKPDRRLAPGEEIFRSSRKFSAWAYTVSHSQLLLRSRSIQLANGRQSRIDLLFKPVEAMKLRVDYYDSLIIRCANESEHEQIIAQVHPSARNNRVLMLESGDVTDYVITGSVGWREEDADDRDPSTLAFFAGGTAPERILPQ